MSKNLTIIRRLFTFLAGSSVGVMLFLATYRGIPILIAATDPGSETSISTENQLDSAGPVEKPISAADTKCSADFPAFADAQRKDFTNFMTAHFKNQSPNSELLPVALSKMKDYRATLLKKRDSYATQQYLGDQVAELSYCSQLVDQQLSIAEQVFESYVQQTAYSKQSTALSLKLSGMNGKLRTLNALLAQLDAYFVTFENKLPGFAKACLKK